MVIMLTLHVMHSTVNSNTFLFLVLFVVVTSAALLSVADFQLLAVIRHNSYYMLALVLAI